MTRVRVTEGVRESRLLIVGELALGPILGRPGFALEIRAPSSPAFQLVRAVAFELTPEQAFELADLLMLALEGFAEAEDGRRRLS